MADIKSSVSGFKLSLNQAELQRLAKVGHLGKGVDCLRHNCELLGLQIDPTHSSLVQLTIGCGYRAFKDDIRDWCKLNSAMRSNMRTPSALPVKMDTDINANRRSECQLSYKCEGEMVHTRTIRFDNDSLCLRDKNWYDEIDGSDVAGPTGSDFSLESERSASRSSSVQSNRSSQTTLVLHQDNPSCLDKLISKAAQTKPYATDEMICKGILEDNRGATHFISSVDLGAKVYLSKPGMPATVHHGVVWKKTRTVVKPEQETVIGCEVSPVWLLVSDKDWRQAMKKACLEYVKEHTAKCHFPLISTGGPLVVSSGKYFLKVREDSRKGFVLEGTDQCQDASDLYIEVPPSTNTSSDPEKARDPLENPDSGFYVYHKRNGIKMYLCADPKDEGTIRLATRIPSPNAYSRFYLESPSTQSLAPLSKWSRESFHLLRQTAYTKRRQYLVVKRTDTNNQGITLRFSSERDDDLQSTCQFSIRNRYNKDSDGNKKPCSNCCPPLAAA